MSEANGINTDNMKLIGYMISNGCIALSGSFLAQNNGFGDLNSGCRNDRDRISIDHYRGKSFSAINLCGFV